jgi:hypothetical protein
VGLKVSSLDTHPTNFRFGIQYEKDCIDSNMKYEIKLKNKKNPN